MPEIKRLKVLHVCEFATARVFKEIYALQEFVDIKLLYARCNYPDLLSLVNNTGNYVTHHMLKEKLLIEDYQLIHVHTSISSLELINLFMDVSKPVIWDIHDWPGDQHVNARNYISGIVTPGMRMLNRVKRQLPKCCLYSKVPEDWVPANTEPSLAAAIVCTGVSTTPDPIWRWYKPIQQHYHVVDGCPFFILPTDNNPDLAKVYDNVLMPQRYLKMLRTISKFSVIFCGSANNDHNIDECVTNKFWEALAVDWTVREIALPGAAEMQEIYQRVCHGHEGVYMDHREISKLLTVYKEVMEACQTEKTKPA